MAPSFDNLQERDEVRIILNAFGYIDDESQEYVIHCLELDLVATGKTIEEAESNLFDIVEAHFAFADENNNWDNIFHPAPPELWAKFYNLAREQETLKRQVRFGSIGRLHEKTPPVDFQLAYA